jgi:hypothetical protein
MKTLLQTARSAAPYLLVEILRAFAHRARHVALAPRGQGNPRGPPMDAHDYWLDSIALALVVVLVIVA